MLAALALAGCAAGGDAGPRAASADPLTDADTGVSACASRLHDLCHWLLLYHARHERLPGSLATLRQASPGADAATWSCPQTGRPYIYDPRGLPAPQRGFLILIQEAPPGHDGTRLGILMAEPRPASPLVLKVATLSPSTR